MAGFYDLFLKLAEKKEHTNVPQNFLSLSISSHEYHGMHACYLSKKTLFIFIYVARVDFFLTWVLFAMYCFVFEGIVIIMLLNL